ncbi:hypothetical protein D8Y22_09445 [Salinadaptatus halalkaliphilus]|uniref:Uncharacterized protein n=1 Tax=Salinadaptatus halalkaliphilus TaxID=2419781 RepID=A0A4S3TQ67_9EURY|nr:hypothetical protein [Salinadaptatus halalkaliphilus]THE65393.1 hypothetical protein D8Y22_09445 [Salinadaptatus halalkaliphilus]
MSGFERRTSLGVGIVLLVVFAWSLWNSLEALTAAPTALSSVALLVAGAAMLFAGLSFVTAGLRERLTVAGRTLEWWQFQYAGFALLGGYMAISGLVQATSVTVYSLLTVVAGVGFVGFGLYHLRHGPTTETDPSTGQIAIVVGGMMALVLLLGLLLVLSI